MPEITPGVIRDWKLEVADYTDGTAPTVWTTVLGIMSFTPPTTEKNLEDDSSFDSGGYGSKMATGLSWKIEGSVKRARASLPEDPGQAILRTAGNGLAEDGFVHVRISNRTKPTAGRVGVADVSFNEDGGEHTKLTTAAFTLEGRGALADVTI